MYGLPMAGMAPMISSGMAGAAPAAGSDIPLWLSLLGIGAGAAAPGMAAMLGRQPRPNPGYAPGASFGSKPPMQPNPNMLRFAQQNQNIPGFLSSLLRSR